MPGPLVVELATFDSWSELRGSWKSYIVRRQRESSRVPGEECRNSHLVLSPGRASPTTVHISQEVRSFLVL
jgi:hypothetical protein